MTSIMGLPFLVLSSGKIDGKVRYGGAVNSHILQELFETIPEIQAEWKNVKVLMLGVSDPTALFTKKPPTRMPWLPSVFVTTTLRKPAGTSVKLKVQVIFSGLTTITSVAGISENPVPFRVTVAPLRNASPVRLTALILLVL